MAGAVSFPLSQVLNKNGPLCLNDLEREKRRLLRGVSAMVIHERGGKTLRCHGMQVLVVIGIQGPERGLA